MAQLQTPRVLIGGVSSGVGKSALCLGIIQELRRRGMSVSCAVSATDLVQALMYRRFTGFASVSLDLELVTNEQCLMSAYLGSLGADIMLIDGSAGVFDLHGGGTSGACDADVAATVGAPIVLTVDARGIQRSAAAILHGYQFMHGAGPIYPLFNHGRSVDRPFFNQLCIDNGFQKMLGMGPEKESFENPLPRGAMQRGSEARIEHQMLVELGSIACDHLDIDGLIALASSAPALTVDETGWEAAPRRARIAYAEDPCFGVCFQNNLAVLRHLGADLATFSPLVDSSLPGGCGAVYLPGCFLDQYAEDLANNTQIADAIRSFADAGGVVYAESGGAAWLTSRFKCEDGKSWQGVGLLPGTAQAKRGRPHSVTGGLVEESILGLPGTGFSGVDTEEWQFEGTERVQRVMQIGRAKGGAAPEGFSPEAQIICTRVLINFASNPEIARALVDSAEVAQKSPSE